MLNKMAQIRYRWVPVPMPQLQCHGGVACCRASLVDPYTKSTKLHTMDNPLWFILCRERKRTKVDSLEGDVSALEAQIADLRVRQAENADLEQQNRCVPEAARQAM